MKINVTARDIRLGLKSMNVDPVRKCPVARALVRHGFKKAEVALTYFDFEQDNKRIGGRLPQSVGNKIQKFDNGQFTQPFSFNLKVKS